jgi:hypothetical protein
MGFLLPAVGNLVRVKFRRVISKRFRRDGDGTQIAGDVNAVISANVGERGSASHVSSRQSARATQASDRRRARDEAEEEDER